MTDKNVKYLTVKEAAEFTGKSESTIKRLVRLEKGNKKVFKYEDLPTGFRKIYISKSFLEHYYDQSSSTVKEKNDPLKNTEKSNVNQGFVDYLLAEVERKNEQLKERDKKIFELMEKQTETVDKFLQLQDQAQKLQAVYSQKQLEESIPKKRWWQRK